VTAASIQVAAEVGGHPVLVSEVDHREAQLRRSPIASALPLAGTSEGRQLRRWLTQLLSAERIVTVEAARLGVDVLGGQRAPTPDQVLPDAAARAAIGSVAAALLDSMPLARALFAAVTAGVDVTTHDVQEYYRRNAARYVPPPAADRAGWRVFPPSGPGTNRPVSNQPPEPAIPEPVRHSIHTELRGAARRHSFARWLDARQAELVRLQPGYEHPGDPRQPDNTHRH
jgi:[acyl-carrier-protein] S-malonyltransferase